MLIGSLRTGATREDIIERLIATHGRIDAGRADSVDVDVITRQFHRQRLHQPDYAMFGSNIMGQILHALDSCGRGDTNNLAASPRNHLGNTDLASNPDTLEIDVDRLIPLLFA